VSAEIPYAIIALGLFSVVAVCIWQARDEKVSIAKKLEAWQTGLSALVGFLAVVVTLTVQDENGAAERAEKATSVTKAFLAEISLITPQLKLMDAFSREIKNAAKIKNTALCVGLVHDMQQHSVLSLGLMQDNRGNISLLPSAMVADISFYYLRLGELSREVGNLEPPDCMEDISGKLGIIDAIIGDMNNAARNLKAQSGASL
jgi:hypothetical protein